MRNNKSDIRLINGDIFSATEAIKKYLSDEKFKIDQEKTGEDYVKITASNLQRSVFKLFLSNSPQIINFNIEQTSDEQVQIDSKFTLFSHFRFFHYACLFVFLCFFAILFPLHINQSYYNYFSSNVLNGIFLSTWIYFFWATILIIISVIFTTKRGNIVSKELFLKHLYNALHNDNFTNEIVIQDNISMQDLLKSFFLVIIFGCIAVLISGNLGKFIEELPYVSIFLGALIVLAIILFGFALILILKPSVGPKGIFLLLGLTLCFPITLHSNIPFLLNFSKTYNEAFQKFQKIENAIKSDSTKEAIWRNYIKDDDEIKSLMTLVSIYYFGLWMLISLFVVFFFINIIEAPIRMIKTQKNISSTHNDSLYNESLHPKNTSYMFNTMIFIIWSFICLALMFGLYFSLTIFERTFLGGNILFCSELGISFFENTKTVFFMLIQTVNVNISTLFHKIMLITQCLPIIVLFILVIRKNLKSTLKGYSLTKKTSEHFDKIEYQLLNKSKAICERSNVRLPLIRIIESPNINAETKYLGFPIFRNVLIITKGTFDELKNNEDELDVLLAHEIWHIKKHTLVRKILCLFSDYSLFGNGFLALLQNSFQTEREADDFAVNWLGKKYQDRNKATTTLKSLLERIEEINWINRIFQSNNSLGFSIYKSDSYLNEILKLYDSSTRIDKIKLNLKLLYQMYFGEEILSYFHPSNMQRIAWIEEKYNTNEAN